MLLLLVPLVVACVASDSAAWHGVVAAHRARHQAMTAQDAYKLVHQGILGTEHAVRDTVRVRTWLAGELAALGPLPSGAVYPLVDTIAPRGRVVRVHLRPFVAAGGEAERLVRAFVASANASPGDTAAFSCAWQGATAAMGPAVAVAMASQLAAMRERGFPAVHHSAPYELAHAPAYRVVAAGHLTALFPQGAPGRPRTAAGRPRGSVSGSPPRSGSSRPAGARRSTP